MSDSLKLLELKRRISRKFLGKFGICGVGLRVEENSVCVYVDNKEKFMRRKYDRLFKIDIGDVGVGIIIEESKPVKFSK